MCPQGRTGVGDLTSATLPTWALLGSSLVFVLLYEESNMRVRDGLCGVLCGGGIILRSVLGSLQAHVQAAYDQWREEWAHQDHCSQECNATEHTY